MRQIDLLENIQECEIEQFEARIPRNINDKQTMYRLFEADLFGNRQVIYELEQAFCWFRHRDTCESPYPSWALRYKVPGYRKWSAYYLEPHEVWPLAERWKREGANHNMFNLTPMMPDEHIVVQGEVMYHKELGWWFRVSKDKAPMNISLGNAEHHSGPWYWKYLQTVMTGSDYDDIRFLLERHPDSVIEFSVYNKRVGWAKGRNSIIWEVRNY